MRAFVGAKFLEIFSKTRDFEQYIIIDMKNPIEYLDEGLFTWSRWRGGSPVDLGIFLCRENIIFENKHILKEFAVGYCDGEKLICRPKRNNKALMFFKNGEHFWFHITNREWKFINEA